MEVKEEEEQRDTTAGRAGPDRERILVSPMVAFSSPRGSALDAALLTRRRQEVLGPAPPGVRASRWDGDGVLDLDSGDWDLSI